MERDRVLLSEDDRHQQALDEAWDWLVKVCQWWCREAVEDERDAQLWRWNNASLSLGTRNRR